jgi:hypothetical protein
MSSCFCEKHLAIAEEAKRMITPDLRATLRRTKHVDNESNQMIVAELNTGFVMTFLGLMHQLGMKNPAHGAQLLRLN